MKHLFTGVVLAGVLALAGCAQLTAIAGTEVPTSKIVAAANAVNPLITVATGYVAYCTPDPAPAGCNDDLIRNQVIPDVTTAQTARNAALAFVEANPDATYGPATLLSAIRTAMAALQTVETQHNLAGATK